MPLIFEVELRGLPRNAFVFARRGFAACDVRRGFAPPSIHSGPKAAPGAQPYFYSRLPAGLSPASHRKRRSRGVQSELVLRPDRSAKVERFAELRAALTIAQQLRVAGVGPDERGK
jgi:hypothetical protein